MSAAATAAQGYQIYRAGDELWLVLNGPLVLDYVDMLSNAVLPAISKEIQRVFVDLKAVDSMDSAGIGLLMKFKMAAKVRGAGITLADPMAEVAEVLSISKVDGIFEILSGTEAEAIRKRLVQPGNKWVEKPTLSADAPSSPFRSEGEPFPQVTSEGAFEDTKSEAARIGEMVEEQCRHAVEAMRQGNYENSVEAYKSALALDPNYLPALNNLAIVYEKQPIWRPLAIDIWNRVLELSRQRNDEKHMKRAERHLADLAE